jgi:dTDP-4-dehydrorhamnose reductase
MRPIVVTGRAGRLGRALVGTAPEPVEGWGLPELDLDRPEACATLVRGARPRLIVHTAAMTDVDGAARAPDLALRRNGDAVGSIARAAHEVGGRLLLISTNEVFDGRRDDGAGYREDDPVAPGNAYGISKLAGEHAAREAFGDDAGLLVVRTAWLYGPPGNDFPDKITAAADRADGPLAVVSDEVGSPTYVLDLARAIWQLAGSVETGTFHLVNAGTASRYQWAAAVLARRRPGQALRPIVQAEFDRPSTPPRWGVLDTTRAAAVGITMRPWQDALAAYLDAPQNPSA